MDLLQTLFNDIFHLDTMLVSFVAAHGLWTYLLVFAVIFCETGLVVTPFLPGDSLLFTIGSISALPHHSLNVFILLPLLIMASILGNQVNYLIGRSVGNKAFSIQRSWLFNQKHLKDAHDFYERHGGKTIILARFIPVIRTFAPFIAGVSRMNVNLFHAYNITSAVLWITCLLGMGFFLGSQPWVKDHFTLVIYGIILISLTPPLYAFLSHHFKNKTTNLT
ncbi:MAG: VTT domain-containing protein [Legionellales bacterium]|nr:VTT domain-containing protein [Legionellales bacterium]